MNKKFSSIRVGDVGFYAPDPGFSKSPMMVLAKSDGKITAFVAPAKMAFNFDADDWMSIDEMETSTHAILTAPFNDTTVQKLKDRIAAVADAHRLWAGRVFTIMDYDAKLNFREVSPTGDDYNEVHKLLTMNPILSGAYDPFVGYF